MHLLFSHAFICLMAIIFGFENKDIDNKTKEIAHVAISNVLLCVMIDEMIFNIHKKHVYTLLANPPNVSLTSKYQINNQKEKNVT